MDIKEQAINGVMWNSVGTLSSFAIDFIVGIILARILTPNEFGLIGTIMVVINISLVFVNSGLSQAIIRKQDCTQTDYSTAFFFNIFIGIFLFLVLFLTARPISLFFNNTALRPLIQVLGFGLIINSFTLVQNAKLTQRIDFRSLTRFTIIASVTSGVISVVMAFSGFGVWSLVAKTLTSQAAITFLLWYHNRWKPEIVFSMESFKSLFRFGSNLLLSGLIGTIFNNIYYAVIGKYFSAQDLGFYTRAELFKNIPSQTAQGIITSVSFPVLAKVKDNPAQLSSAFKKILTTTFFIVSLLMFGWQLSLNQW
jgi:O-antigen/teichoic acid export membrane protein